MAMPIRAASQRETTDAIADALRREDRYEERSRYPRGRILPVERLQPKEMLFPIPSIEMLPQPWRESPWLERGIYHGFESDDVRPISFVYETSPDGGQFEEGHEIIWVAVDGNGREIAIARWGNWSHEQREEAIELTRERRAAVATAMLDLLDQIDPVDGERPAITFPSDDVEPTVVSTYPRTIAAEHRRMSEADQLLTPGMHFAPFRSRSGRPVIAIVDDAWRLRAVVEIAPIGSPFAVAKLKGTFREKEREAWHPIDVYRRANQEQLDVLPPGIHVAPWLPAEGVYGCREAFDLIALDRHSRFVAAVTVGILGNAVTRTEAEQFLRERLAEDDPVYRELDALPVADRNALDDALAGVYDHIDHWQFGRPDPAADEEPNGGD